MLRTKMATAIAAMVTVVKGAKHPTTILSIAAMLLCMMTSCVAVLTTTTSLQRVDACKLVDGVYSNDICTCNTRASKHNVVCRAKPAITLIPRNIPLSVSVLYIVNCDIKEINEYDFAGMENMTSLVLNSNGIRNIHPNAFRNLYKLNILNLENNTLTRLDPTGQLFQHLSSLTGLYLLNSRITQINKLSFYTLGQQNLVVQMSGNAVTCNCEVKALKRWRESLTIQKISFQNLMCNNFMNRSYLDVPDSAFGNCPDSSLIESIPSQCRDCDRVSTHYGCNQQDFTQCTGSEQVCRETLTWEPTTKRMVIGSGCSTYQSCVVDASGTNPKSCGVDFAANVKCVFCCLGPICNQTTIGGRTVDYVFDLRYTRNLDYQTYMENPQSPDYRNSVTAIQQGITSILNGIDGGFQVVFKQFVRLSNQAHIVILRIHVTTLNTGLSQSIILGDILSKMKRNAEVPNGFLNMQQFRKNTVNVKELSGTYTCREALTFHDGNSYLWPETSVSQSEPAQSQCPNSNSKFALRNCILDTQGDALWTDTDFSACDEKPDTDTDVVIDDLEKVTVTKDNVVDVSDKLLAYMNDEESLITPERMDKVVNVLEKLVTTENLAVDGVPNKVVSTVSRLVDVDAETMRKAQVEKSTSQRLLNVIDLVGERSPLNDNGDSLEINTPNIAIAAQGIQSQETRDVILIAEDPSEDNVQIDVRLQNGFRGQEETSLVIPTKALVDALPANQRQNLERITFAVHKEDKLFYVPPKDDTVVVKQNDTNRYLYRTQVNGQIIAASVPGVTVKDLKDNITMTFAHDSQNATSPQCVSWKQSLAGGQGDWSDEGCGVVETSNTSTTCGCSHLTNFALLMDVYQEGGGLSDIDKKVISIISYIGCGISLVALLLTLLTYGWFRKLRRDNPSKILINLCLALFMSNLVFLVGMQDYAFDNDISCKIVAVLLHYFLLSSLTWMAVEAFYMYLALILVFKTYFTRFILKCMLVGWGIPLIIIITTLVIDATDNYGFVNNGLCWLKNPAFYAAFVAPVCIILVINCVAFGLVIRQLVNMTNSKITRTDRSSTIQRLRGALGVFILLGLSWIFAIFAIDSASVVFYYLFTIFNSLQGLFIFIFYCLFKKDVINTWKRILCCFDEYGEQSKTSSNSRASTTANAHHAVRLNTKSNSSSVSANTMSTASTVASYSRKSSNVYSNIDDSETERLNFNDKEYRQTSVPNQTPSPPPSVQKLPATISQPERTDHQQVQEKTSVDPSEVDVGIDYRSGQRVRDLCVQFDRRSSNTSDVEITRI